MPYTINNTAGTKLVVLQDGTIDVQTTDITLIGKGYAGFGERFNENLVKMLENFANTTQPNNSIRGQLWYDTVNNQLKVYTGTMFKPVGSSTNSDTKPASGMHLGDTWFDTTNNQLYVYNGVAWVLIGPTSVAGSGVTQVVSDTVIDTVGVNRSILKFVTNDIVVAIVSQSEFTPETAIPGFTTIKTGITINSTSLSGAKFHGSSTNSDALGGDSAAAYLSSNDGGTVSGDVNITGITSIGPTQELTLAVSESNATVENTAQDGDIVFQVNRQGVQGTEALAIDGGTGIVNIPDLRVTGTLTVQGTQTIVNTQRLSVEDNIIELNRNISVAGAMPVYSGIKVSRGYEEDPTEHDLYWVWDENFNDDGTTAYGNAGGAWSAYRARNDIESDGAPELVDVRANTIHATATAAQYADLAERYEADCATSPGDVVVLGGEKEITLSNVELDTRVFGVISTAPAFLMNKDAGDDLSHPMVALKGRVPVKVHGTGKKGDRIVTSNIPGVARVADLEDCSPFTVIGRLLTDKYNVDTELTQCAIGVN